MRLGALALLAVSTFAPTASADDVADCLSAHEQGQVDKREGHFDRAREAFANCQRDVCPSAVRARCTEFARSLETAQPTVVVIVHDAKGADVPAARVSVDGAPSVEVSGMGMRLNPGSRRLRVEAPGLPAVEKTIVVHEGVKDAQAVFALGTPSSASLPALEPLVENKPATAAWVFTVTGGVFLAGAGVLSGVGWATHENLKSSCGSTGCPESRVEQLRVLWPASFIALGVGVASAIVATVLFATHSGEQGARSARLLSAAGEGLPF